MASLIFYIAAALTLLGAVFVLVLPNPLRAAIALILSLGGLSVIYLMLHAQFVAVMQVLVYAGAIMVLFVFVIMLLNLQDPGTKKRLRPKIAIAYTLIASASLLVSHLIYRNFKFPLEKPIYRNFGSVEHVGAFVLNEFALPFEMLSLLLLVAVLGAVVMTKKRL